MIWCLFIIICLYIVYYAQGMGLPTTVRFFSIKKILWGARAIIVVGALFLALASVENKNDTAQFFAMFALANSLALPYKRNAIPKVYGNSLIEGLKSKIGFSIGSALFLLIVSFVAVKLTNLFGNSEYWYAFVIFVGCIGLYANESGLSQVYSHMDLGDNAKIGLQHRNNILPIVCLAYIVSSTLIAFNLFDKIELQFGNWTGWSGLLIGAIFGGLFEFD